MHTVDMGVAPFVVGSILWELVAKGTAYPGSSVDKRLENAFVAYKHFCKRKHIHVQSSAWNVKKLNKKDAKKFPFMKSKAF
jgi:hypothetical protein